MGARNRAAAKRFVHACNNRGVVADDSSLRQAIDVETKRNAGSSR
jgi:hypothetical protein